MQVFNATTPIEAIKQYPLKLGEACEGGIVESIECKAVMPGVYQVWHTVRFERERPEPLLSVEYVIAE